MSKKQKFWELVKFHGSIALRGLARTVWGAVIAVSLAVAIYGFIVIGKESGYIAVFDFIASLATLVVAACNIYLLGIKKRGAKK